MGESSLWAPAAFWLNRTSEDDLPEFGSIALEYGVTPNGFFLRPKFVRFVSEPRWKRILNGII